jgi:hypothetical protein
VGQSVGIDPVRAEVFQHFPHHAFPGGDIPG